MNAPLAVRFDIRSAACRDEDPELWFDDDDLSDEERAARAEQAKAICRSCPLVRDCREWSLTVKELYGIWGGTDEEERAVLIRKRARKPRCVVRGCDRSGAFDGLCPGHHPTVEDRYSNRYRREAAA